MDRKENDRVSRLPRRDLVRAVAGLSALGAVAASNEPKRVVWNGRIKQSVALWCFSATEWKWDIEKVCSVAKALGCQSVELVFLLLPVSERGVIGFLVALSTPPVEVVELALVLLLPSPATSPSTCLPCEFASSRHSNAPILHAR